MRRGYVFASMGLGAAVLILSPLMLGQDCAFHSQLETTAETRWYCNVICPEGGHNRYFVSAVDSNTAAAKSSNATTCGTSGDKVASCSVFNSTANYPSDITDLDQTVIEGIQ